MKRKSGLHKKVSSIFGGASLPADGLSADTPFVQNDVAVPDQTDTPAVDSPTPGIGDPPAKPQYQHHTPASETTHRTVAKVAPAVLTEDEEYEAAQKRKLIMVIGLAVVFALVLFFNLYEPGEKTVTTGEELSVQAASTGVSEINWPEPEIWPTDIRDPMVFKADASRLHEIEIGMEGPFVLRGIIHNENGRSMVLLGEEILSEGDEIDGWTVKEVLKNVVRLEKADGEKLELKMEDR